MSIEVSYSDDSRSMYIEVLRGTISAWPTASVTLFTPEGEIRIWVKAGFEEDVTESEVYQAVYDLKQREAQREREDEDEDEDDEEEEGWIVPSEWEEEARIFFIAWKEVQHLVGLLWKAPNLTIDVKAP